ncbi:HAD hydrolase, family IB [Atopobium sp. oral taxon 199 str. F0494]|nr:HAD hydrolase, family IB [Atopobium sp. oral taxon 199 str. F0494]
MEHTRKVAVFDFDGTVISGQSGFLFAAYLYRQHISSLARTLRLAWWGIRYKFHLPQRQEEARELVVGALTEMSAAQADEVMCSFYQDVIAPRFRPEALAAAKRYRSEGYVVLLVSATFVPIAELAAAHLGADGFMATRMQIANGHYTSHVLGSVIEGAEKPRAVERWCDEHLGAGAWKIVVAYGDHYSDVPLLEQAQAAHAVCPGPTLAKIARQRGWEVLNWSSA